MKSWSRRSTGVFGYVYRALDSASRHGCISIVVLFCFPPLCMSFSSCAHVHSRGRRRLLLQVAIGIEGSEKNEKVVRLTKNESYLHQKEKTRLPCN